MSRHPTISSLVRKYLAHRRTLGFALCPDDRLLMSFARFADDSGHRGPLTTELVLRWASLPPAASQRYRAHRLSTVRSFARYLAVRDGRTQVPDRGLLGKIVLRPQPHIYSDHQLQQLITAAAELGPTDSLRPQTYRTLFGLLACTGLRISEALKLSKNDVDLDHGILNIVQTKFRKSRLVPLHPSVVPELQRYAKQRDKDRAARDATTFFIGRQARGLHYRAVHHVFRSLIDTLGWRSNGALARPRIHDLRHSFACRRLLAWYEAGVDVNHAIAALSTYMGHTTLRDTYWYLTGTPQLLATAGACFEAFASLNSRRQP